jgi:hypothetical protein
MNTETLVSKQEVTANMAFPIAIPIAHEWMVLPFWPERTIIGNQQQHHLFELMHVVSTRMR